MNMLKKVIFGVLILAFALPSFALKVKLEQNVKVDKSISETNPSAQIVSREKKFKVAIEEAGSTDVVYFFFSTAGGTISSDVVATNIARQTPLKREYEASATSETYIEHPKVDPITKKRSSKKPKKIKNGDDKVEACIFVYDQKNSKLIGTANTFKPFADEIKA